MLSIWGSFHLHAQHYFYPDTDQWNWQMKVLHYRPHCGGMAPNPEQLRNRYQPEIDSFVLINLTGKDTIPVQTDSNGIVRLYLYPGQYAVREKYKMVPFRVFYEQHYRKSDNFLKTQGIDCYKKWWKSNLTQFEITPHTEQLRLKVVVAEGCFVGLNPCLKFIGPPPP